MNDVTKSKPTALIRSLIKRLFQLALVLLVVFTTYVTGGRLLMPVLTTQKDQVAVRLSHVLGVDVSIGSLQGSWFRFSPGIELGNLALQLDPADPASTLKLAHGELTLDLWSSLKQRQLALNMMSFSQLQLTLEQHSNGTWGLAGLPQGEGRFAKQLADLLLSTPFIVINEANLLIRFADGRAVSLQSVFLRLENQDQEHQLSLQFRAGEQNSPMHARLELQGDPRSSFVARAWAQSDGTDLQQLAGVLPEQLNTTAFSAAGQLWMSLDNTGIESVSGQLDNLVMLGNYGANSIALGLNSASVNFVARPQYVQTRQNEPPAVVWKLALQNLAYDWNNAPWELPRLDLVMPLDAAANWQLQVETLDIAMLTDLARSMPLPTAALSALETLAPTGTLHHLVLESDRIGQYPDLFQLRAEYEHLAVGAWGGAPAGSGLGGYTEVSASRGLAIVDSDDVSIYLPKLFREPWQYEHLNTEVSWSLHNGDVAVSSTPIHINNEFLQGRVQFSLHTLHVNEDDIETDLSLLVGMDYMDVAIHSAYLPTMEKLAPTMSWLDRALKAGRIVNSGFVLRTVLDHNTLATSSAQVSWFRVQQGVLQFLPQWPLVTVATAGITVRDHETDILGMDAGIGGLLVQDVKAQIRPAPAGGSWLSLNANALTSTAAGIDFLRTTPLRDFVGTTLDNWDATGMLDIDVALGIPLGDNTAQQQIAVAARSLDSTLDIKDYSLNISAINGLFNYHQDTGLQADTLTASMFGNPVAIAIATQLPGSAGQRTIQINSAGIASTSELAAWKGQSNFIRSLFGFTEGEVNYKAILDIPGAGAAAGIPRLQIQAGLSGTKINFPAPFQKALNEPGQLQLDLNFTATGQTLALRYNDWMSGQLVLSEGIDRGQLYFGKLNESFNIRQTNSADPGLLISGNLQDFSYEQWERVANIIAQQQDPGSSSLKEYLRLIDVNVEHLQVLGQNFENINVQVEHKDEAWHIYGQNTLLAGNFIVQDAASDLPWDIDLKYLRFPPREVPETDLGNVEEEPDLLQDLDPSTLPPFNFNTAELSIGDSNLGAFRFALKPDANGAQITDFYMQEDTSLINGGTTDTGASIDWRYLNGQHQSQFKGVFAAGDLAKVMPKWGHDANIVSRQARFSGELAWPGSPLAFSLKKASGEISMAINNGRFVDINSGSSRLLGAFNFDALVRRLELDFSDLYERGFSYDTIKGELTFVDGVVHTLTPLIIDGPSSRLNIKGEISLPKETIAADMQVRIPLGQNISLLAGLLGAWPIAVSTYLASKIFADQVEDFTTIIYRLEGPWANPQAGFEAPSEEVHE